MALPMNPPLHPSWEGNLPATGASNEAPLLGGAGGGFQQFILEQGSSLNSAMDSSTLDSDFIGSEILTPWNRSDPLVDAEVRPHPSLLPLGEGESTSALDKTGVSGVCSDWMEGSLS
jgi:hypothetical protein